MQTNASPSETSKEVAIAAVEKSNGMEATPQSEPRYFGEEALYIPISEIQVPGFLRDIAISDEERERIKDVIANHGLKDEVHVYSDSTGFTLLSDPHIPDIARELAIETLRCIIIHSPLTEQEKKLYALEKVLLNVQLPEAYRIESVKEIYELTIKIQKEAKKIEAINPSNVQNQGTVDSPIVAELVKKDCSSAEACAKLAGVGSTKYKHASELIEKDPKRWKLVKEKKLSVNAAWKEYKAGTDNSDNPFHMIHDVTLAVGSLRRKLEALRGVYYVGMKDQAFEEALRLKGALNETGLVMMALSVDISNAALRRRQAA